MATYNFSALSNGQAISFNPTSDVLNFDQTAISAGNLAIDLQGSDTRVTVLSGTDAGKTITLLSAMPPQLASSNVHFANGSGIFFGDNSPSTAGDDAANSLDGTGGNDLIKGFGGNDTIFANAGNDRIESGAGNDTISGGGGQDQYVWHEYGAANADTVLNFDTGWDSIQLDAAAFTQIGAAGRFATNDVRFYAAPGATGGHDADDRIIYNTTTGQLWYDADGNGPGAPQLIATLPAGSTVVASDINVFGNAAPPPPPPGQTINGTAGNDTLTGGPGNDTISGLAGDDSINGGGGDDSLNGGDGNDSLTGGWNNDTIDGGAGQDWLMLSGGQTNVTINLATGSMIGGDAAGTAHAVLLNIEAVEAGAVNVSMNITGSAGNDFLRGGSAADTIMGGAGNDTVYGSGLQNANGDQLFGGDGNDLMSAFAGNSTLDGGAGDDIVSGGTGSDLLIGGTGNDALFSSGGNDTLTGGAGRDQFSFYAPPGPANASVVTDFASASGDFIVLSGNSMPALGPSGNLSSTDPRFSSGPSYSSGTVLFYNTTTGQLTYNPDPGNSSASPQLIATFTGAPSISATNIQVQNNSNEINGTSGNDSLVGTSGNDTINGNDGDDTLNGLAGNDALAGGNGKDVYVFDQTPGAANADTIYGFEAGWDKIQIDASVMSALGPSGPFSWADPRFYAANGATGGHDADDRIIYDTSNGNLYYDADGNGTGAAQLIAKLPGVVVGGTPSAQALDASDIVVVNGGSTGLVINGTAGNDQLSGTPANDTINGLGGNDSIDGAGGNDSVDGGDGNDTIWATGGNDLLIGGAGDDVFMGAVGSGADTMQGGDGADTFSEIWADGDAIDGGAGIDTVAFIHNSLMPSGVIVDLTAGTISGGEGNATIVNVENVQGSVLSDSITGNAGPNRLIGSDGNDTINGGDGNDTIYGDLGNDILTGGTGADNFSFQERGAPDADTITDFTTGVDQIHLDAYVMRALGVKGGLAAGDARFYAAPGASAGHDSDDRVIYDTSSGQLWYDADGNGTGAAQLIATLQGAPALAATDIFVDNGTDPNQSINGTDGNDSLTGGTGNDTINGLGGDDTLSGGGGADSLYGGAGNDSLFGGYDPNFAPNGNDPGDYLNGGDGNDTLNGSSGRGFSNTADTMDGGLGNDYYVVDNANDVLIDAGGIDTVRVENLNWTLPSGFENLHLADDISESNHTAIGNDLDNLMTIGWTGTLYGMGGNDTLEGSVKTSDLYGGDGNDLLIAGTLMDGGAGDDTLMASGTMTGGTGADHFVFNGTFTYFGSSTITDFQSGLDKIHVDNLANPQLGTAGNFAAGDPRFYAAAGATGGHDADDRIVYDTSTGRLYYDADGSGSQTAGLITTLQGAPLFAATDIVVENGTYGASISGTDGNDSLVGGPNDDTISGGAGNDTLVGNGGNDALYAGNGDDLLLGGAGNDGLFADVGNDTLNGGLGADTLDGYGDTNVDVFVFDVAPGVANADRVLDFTSGVDKIQLDATVMTALGASGNFAAGDPRFYAAAGATGGHDADDRVIYNTSTGELWYDADGSGTTAAQLIATVGWTYAAPPALAATDIVVANGGQTINGTSGNDSLVGGSGGDTINGFGGNDSLVGNEGADSLNGGDGNDTLDAWVPAHGDDRAVDTLDGGLGDDVYQVSRDGDIILPDPGGVDTVRAMDTSWTLGAGLENLDLVDNVGSAFDGTGNDLNNTILSATEGGTLSGMGGDDLLVARHVQNTVTLRGGDGNDTLDGSGWHTNMFGDAGDDLLLSGGGADLMTGGAGADTFRFTDFSDYSYVQDFASGTDKLSFDGKAFTTIGASGNFSAGDPRFFAGTAAHDADDRVIFDAATGNLWYDADGNGGGSAVMVAHVTGNVVATDIAVINGSSGGTPPSPPPGSIVGTDANDDIVGGSGNDTIYGMGGNDFLAGSSGADSIVGGAGNDTIYGDADNDWIEGSTGNDSISGGGGQDSIVFREFGAANADTVANFSGGWDNLRFDHNGFTQIGAVGHFAAGDARFYAAAGASGGHDADDRLIYNTSTGQLYYDADGNGAGAAEFVATLQGAPGIAATDMWVI